MPHSIKYYACGKHVLTQCRCMNPNKAKVITDKPCPHPHSGCRTQVILSVNSDIKRLRADVMKLAQELTLGAADGPTDTHNTQGDT